MHRYQPSGWTACWGQLAVSADSSSGQEGWTRGAALSTATLPGCRDTRTHGPATDRLVHDLGLGKDTMEPRTEALHVAPAQAWSGRSRLGPRVWACSGRRGPRARWRKVLEYARGSTCPLPEGAGSSAAPLQTRGPAFFCVAALGTLVA